MNTTRDLDLKVRPMRAADLERVVAIEQAVFTMPWTEATYHTLLKRRDADVFVADVEGDVVGYAAFWAVGDQGELGNLAVASGWRGRGIASALMRRVFESAAERGVREVFLEVRVSNRVARDIYTHYGFEQISRRRLYYSAPVEDAYVLRKRLGADGAGDNP